MFVVVFLVVIIVVVSIQCRRVDFNLLVVIARQVKDKTSTATVLDANKNVAVRAKNAALKLFGGQSAYVRARVYSSRRALEGRPGVL